MKVQKEPSEYNLKTKETINIMPLGDLHIGSAHSNPEYIRYAIRSLKKRRGSKRVYLMGDLLEVADKRVGDSAFTTKADVNDQIEEVLKVIKPIKKYVVSVVMGNHEKRLKYSYNLNLTRLIANMCDIKLWGYQTLDQFKINGRTFNIHSYHGKGVTRYLYTSFGKVMRETQHINADLFFYGHLHFLGHYSVPMIFGNEIRRKNYILTGHFLEYDETYADAALMDFRPESFCILTVNGEGRVHFIPFYSDERAWRQ
ncbi:MAG TPA: hypothetical protein PKZ88_08240 [Methanothermobacter sp.]|nr:hypothetical protein [Methanothermobacter sp.]